MHQPILDGLEEFLSGAAGSPRLAAFHAHLAQCAECSRSVEAMTHHSHLLRALRPEREVDPAPGFYARVIDRIEAQRPSSFWSIFLEPAFSRRLAVAAFALLLVLSGMALTGARDSVVAANATPESVLATHEMAYPPAPGLDQQHDRDVVFAKLATWSDSQQPDIVVISE